MKNSSLYTEGAHKGENIMNKMQALDFDKDIKFKFNNEWFLFKDLDLTQRQNVLDTLTELILKPEQLIRISERMSWR